MLIGRSLWTKFRQLDFTHHNGLAILSARWSAQKHLDFSNIGQNLMKLDKSKGRFARPHAKLIRLQLRCVKSSSAAD
jgi:hypothetical protein